MCARVRAQLQIRSNNETQQEQAERLRTIVNNMAEGLLIIEADGRIQYTNPACDEYLGYRENEMVVGGSISRSHWTGKDYTNADMVNNTCDQ